MAEYIDREAVKKFLHEEDFGTPDERWRPESEFAHMIDALPTADVVEVVRCKKCIYHNVPPCPMRLSLNWTNDNDFCSYGERKEIE